MLEALARAGSSVAKPSKSKGKGKGAPQKDASAMQVLQHLAPLVLNLERKVNALEDRATFVCTLRSEDWKDKIYGVRSLWRQKEEERRAKFEKEKEKAGGGMDVEMDAHPLGGPLRAVILKTIFELLAAALPGDHPEKKSITTMSSADVQEFVKIAFRARPRHNDPMKDRNWTWCFILVENPHPDVVKMVPKLYDIVTDHCKFAPQNTRDGPLAKWLGEWCKLMRDSATDERGNAKRRRDSEDFEY